MKRYGGYFLLLPIEEQKYYLEIFKKTGLFLNRIVSLDEEIGGVFPNVLNLWEIENNAKRTKELKNYPSKEIINRMLLPSVFETLEDAISCYQELKHRHGEMYVIGISLHEKYVKDFFEYQDFSNEGEGVVRCIENKKVLCEGGQVIGYDIVGYNLGSFTSFLKNHLQEDYKKYFSTFMLNKFGLISEEKTAELLAGYSNEVLIDEVGAENLLWLPWEVTLYKK